MLGKEKECQPHNAIKFHEGSDHDEAGGRNILFFLYAIERSDDDGDNFYHPEADGGISILDDTLGIDWKIPTEHANLSEKDTKHAMLKDFDSPFDINVDLYQ